MKRALTGIVSVGILAVTVGVDTATAQPYRRYGPARTYTSQAYTPQSPGSFRREGGLRTTPFSDPIEPSRTGKIKRRSLTRPAKRSRCQAGDTHR